MTQADHDDLPLFELWTRNTNFSAGGGREEVSGVISGLPTLQTRSSGGHLCEKRGTYAGWGTWCDLKARPNWAGRGHLEYSGCKTSSQFSFGLRNDAWPPDSPDLPRPRGSAARHPGIVATSGSDIGRKQQYDFPFTLLAL
jgi:hypothetical protein